METYEICYCAKYPYGDVLDKDKPFKTAYIEASSMIEAAAKLKSEFPGMQVSIYSVKS